MYSLFFNQMEWTTLTIYLIVFLVYWLLSYVFKRNEKALRMLVEQMSDTDFELLLKIRDNFSFPYKYDPPFVLCNNHLYIFLFHTIKEIDPTQITEINCENNRNSIFVRLKSPKRTMFTLPNTTFSYFLQIVEQYTKLK